MDSLEDRSMTQSQESHIPSRVALLARADMLLVLADLLRSPAHQWPRQALPAAADIDQLMAVADIGDADGALAAELRNAVSEAAIVQRDQLSDEHHRLFEGAMPCPLNETAYVRRDKGAIIGDLAGFYAAFGFEPSTASGEKCDHLLVELEFIAALLVMTAEAHDAEQRATAAAALSDFAAAHAGDWIPAVCTLLGEVTVLPLFQHTAGALELLWQRLVADHGWPITPETAAASARQDEPESPYECGAPGADQLVALSVGGEECAT
jgi:putative dimethyl sulfoxide reductase chaperone